MDLTGWTPARIRWDTGPCVEWVYTGTIRFTDPFFEQTVGRAVRDPFSLLFRRRTPIEALGCASPGLAPRGFVFHMSRSGSTLVAQMLARSTRLLVLSEPGPVDWVLRAPAGREQRVAWLRALLSALGRPPADESGLVLKLDSWSVLDLDLVEEAFPGVPWIFLYREPLEVLASQLRVTGAHGVPAALPPELFGIEPGDLAVLSREDYLGRVLARICEAALKHGRSRSGLFINYRQLPGAVLERVADHFGLRFAADERERMREAARLDAKNPVLPFERGSHLATAEARRVTEERLRPLYERLEEMAASC